MEEYVLETKELTKEYKYATALDHVNLHLKRGHIYGFIGNNGAGKTTLMRLIMGLAFADSGELMLFGEGGQRALERQRRRIGALIEQPVAYDNMSARQNLIYERMISLSEKEKRRGRITGKAAHQPRGGGEGADPFVFSWDAAAVRDRGGALRRAGFLVLDRPTSGLDPAGDKGPAGAVSIAEPGKGDDNADFKPHSERAASGSDGLHHHQPWKDPAGADARGA